MFTLTKNFYKWAKAKREKNLTLVLLGLDSAGKTTLLHAIKEEVPDYVTPTYGFNKETLAEGPYTIEVFDLGGGKRIRSIWSEYLASVHGAVFVIDAADSSRFDEAKEVLMETLANPYLSSKPILIMANKQDLPTAADVSTIASALGLGSVQNNRYHILPCVAKTDEGGAPDKRVKEGIKWMSANISPDYKELQARVTRDSAIEKEKAARKMEEKKKRVAEMKAQRAKEAAEAEAREQQERSAGESEGAPLVPAQQQEQQRGGQEASESVSYETAMAPPGVYQPNKASEGRETPSSLEVSSLTAGPSSQAIDASPFGSKSSSLSHIPGAIPSPVKSRKPVLEPLAS